MATFLFRGRIWKLTGENTRATVANIEVLPGPVNGGDGSFVRAMTVPIVDGEFSVDLPQDATPSGYRFRVTFPQLGDYWWEFEPPPSAGTTVWLSDYQPYVHP